MARKIINSMARVYGKIPEKLVTVLYCLAFSLVLIYDYAFLTQFDREPFRKAYILGAALAGLVLLIRFLNIKNEDWTYIVVSVLLLLIGGGYFLVRHSYYFLVLAMLMVGVRRVEARKLYILYCAVTGAFFLVMFVHFLIHNGGFAGEWTKEQPVLFGSINSTDCQGMVFFLLTAYLFARDERVRYIELAVLAGIVLWFWYHTRAEFNLCCSLACLLIAAVRKAIRGKAGGRKEHRRLCYALASAFLVLAAVMIALVVLYDPESEKWFNFNELLHRRFGNAHRVLFLYPPCLWGREFFVVGHGYDPSYHYWEMYNQYGYTFIDSSYPNILIMHGYLVFAMILGVMTWVSLRYARRGRLYEVLLLAVLAVDFAAESHMKEISCNIWLLLPFAALTLPGKPEAAPGLTEQAGGAGKGRVNNRHSNRKRK